MVLFGVVHNRYLICSDKGLGDPRRAVLRRHCEGHARKHQLWSEQGRAQLEKLRLATWASRRRQDLLELLDRMNPTIEELTRAVEQEAKKRPEVLWLMTHLGVGPLTALAFVLIIGTPERFKCGKQIGSYVGLIPSEDSSAGHQRLRNITSKAVLCCVSCGEKQHNFRIGIEVLRYSKRTAKLLGDLRAEDEISHLN
jgi:transposase